MMRGGGVPAILPHMEAVEFRAATQSAISAVLERWREAERIRHSLPDDAPEAERAEAEVQRARSEYRELYDKAAAEHRARR
jgi:hypothetical protein